jgi:hypothetical protein
VAASGAPVAPSAEIPLAFPAFPLGDPTATGTQANLASDVDTSRDGPDVLVTSFGAQTLSGTNDAGTLGGDEDDRPHGTGDTVPFALAGLGTIGGPGQLDRLPTIPEVDVPKNSALDKDGRPIDNWFSVGLPGMSTESLRAQAQQFGVDAANQRYDAWALGAVQQSGQFIGGVTGATVLGGWGATEGAITGFEFGPYGALLNGTVGLVVGARKGWQYGSLAGQALGSGVFNGQIHELNLGANQSEAMQQFLNAEIYRREVEQRFADQAAMERLAPPGTSLSFGHNDQVAATALDGTVIPQPTLVPQGTVLPDGSLLPEEGAGLDPLDGLPDLMRQSVDFAAGDVPAYEGFGPPAPTEQFSFPDFVPYQVDPVPPPPAATFDFGDVELYPFDASSTYDTSDLVFE